MAKNKSNTAKKADKRNETTKADEAAHNNQGGWVKVAGLYIGGFCVVLTSCVAISSYVIETRTPKPISVYSFDADAAIGQFVEWSGQQNLDDLTFTTELASFGTRLEDGLALVAHHNNAIILRTQSVASGATDITNQVVKEVLNAKN